MSCDGLLVVDKPVSLTSHDVVDRVRRVFGERRVGHTGTLDPGASGVLVVCIGRATRLVRFLQEGTKVYTGAMILGVTTDTLDADGTETGRAPCGAKREDVERAMATLVGTLTQTPPMVSAVKVGGAKMYELARKGVVVGRKPRVVRVERFEMTSFAEGDFPRVAFEVECGKGTYVRSLAAEVGATLGCGAHLAELRRTKNGSYSIDQAETIQEIEAAPGRTPAGFVSLDEIDVGLSELHLGEAARAKVKYGAILASETHPELLDVEKPGCFVVRDGGRLLAVYRVERHESGVTARPECVLAPAGAGSVPAQ